MLARRQPQADRQVLMWVFEFGVPRRYLIHRCRFEFLESVSMASTFPKIVRVPQTLQAVVQMLLLAQSLPLAQGLLLAQVLEMRLVSALGAVALEESE
jgi:hypothetical protein